MKKLLLIFFVSIGLFTSCVEKPEEDPDVLPPPGNVTAEFDDQTFESVTTLVEVSPTSMALTAISEDGSYFKVNLPENPIIGTYNLSTLGDSAAGFSLEYNEGIGTDSYVAPLAGSSGPAEVVILGIDQVNRRISGTFRFTGKRYRDTSPAVLEEKQITNGIFLNIPYTLVDELTIDEDDILPTKFVVSFPGTTIANESTVYTFNNKKIVKAINTDSDGIVKTTEYSYNVNLITKIEVKSSSNVVLKREIFVYDASNKLLTYIISDIVNAVAVKENYVHNTDGSISVSRFIGNLSAQNTADGTSTIFFNNGEVTEIVFSDGSAKTYTYDNSNYTLKNVIGYEKISFVGGEARGINNNVLSETIGGVPTYNFTLLYTENNFPLKATDTGIEINYFYE